MSPAFFRGNKRAVHEIIKLWSNSNGGIAAHSLNTSRLTNVI